MKKRISFMSACVSGMRWGVIDTSYVTSRSPEPGTVVIGVGKLQRATFVEVVEHRAELELVAQRLTGSSPETILMHHVDARY